jgi:hypothetical protein
MRSQELLSLNLNGLRQHTAGTIAHDLAQGIFKFSWLNQLGNVIVCHGVFFLIFGVLAGFDSPATICRLLTRHQISCLSPNTPFYEAIEGEENRNGFVTNRRRLNRFQGNEFVITHSIAKMLHPAKMNADYLQKS